ncbi:MAG: hypothetical protein ABI232_02415 [Jatrophihabitantaceae bacterium]
MTGQDRGAVGPAVTNVFDARRYSVFECTSLDVNFESGAVEFGYALDGTGRLMFTERLLLPLPAGEIDASTRAGVLAVLQLTHWVAGVSYFKAAAPDTVRIGDEPMTEAELRYVAAIYRDGLAEFAYTNDLPSALRTAVVSSGVAADPVGIAVAGNGRPLVACGGGKDSIVSLEALRSAGLDPVSFVVNPNAITRAVVERSDTPLLAVTRTIDPALFALNSTGAHNGHVPVTAINSLLAVAVSILHGLGPVVMSNESSASAPNLTWHQQPVNHQWSKGIDAERLLRQALASRLGPQERYFSLLRHLNELQIAGRFAALDGYDDVMTSCNRAFTITKNSGARWCRNCPKCRFVFLALACFVPAERVVGILGGDLLRDCTQLEGYRELLGFGSPKPFECVGELDESVAAIGHLGRLDAWQDAQVVDALMKEIAATARPVPTLASVLAQRGPSLAPTRFVATLDATH